MVSKELNEILENHLNWLRCEGGERADLRGADLRSANFRSADLRSADLSSADLRSADLRSADLREADLHGADLSSANIDLLMILQTNMVNLSEELTLELMRWDALVCGKEKMKKWADGGSCPFSGGGINRLFRFEESRNLWRPGKPKKNIYELWQAIAKELEIKI